MSVARLTWAEIRQRPGRLIVTSLAVVASAAAVVWVVSGYDALTETIEDVGEEYHGRYDAWAAAQRVSAEDVAALRADPDVLEVEPVVQRHVVVEGPLGVEPAGPLRFQDDSYGGEGAYLDGDNSAVGSHERPPVLVGTTAADPPRALSAGRWIDPDASRLTGVVSDRLAKRLGARVGETLQLRVDEVDHPLEVIGVVQETLAATVTGETVLDDRGDLDPRRGTGPASAAIYLHQPQLDALFGAPTPPNLVCLKLRRGVDLAAFRARWAETIAGNPAGSLLTTDDLREALSQTAMTRAARTQSYAATAVSLLAALFIIFTALSMGVSERTRELAVLRATGFTRSQIAGLVGLEALVLAGVGWLGGMAAGWALLAIAAGGEHGLDATLGVWAVALSGACAFVGALAAAIPPAWVASRIDIVAALSERREALPWRWFAHATVVGLALIALLPLILTVEGLDDTLRALLFAGVGCPALALGFLLICPAVVVVVERLFGAALARLLRLPPALLRSQLSSNLTRTVGTAAALTIGLGLFITIQVWGRSMLQPFLPGVWAPPGLVSAPARVDLDAVRDLAQLPEVEHVEPLWFEQALLADDITGVGDKGESVVRQDNIVLIGVDPAGAALAGEHPLFDLSFVQGSREQALELLRQGRHVVVPDHFVRATGLGVGDSFRLVPPASPTVTVEYTIAGVVALPGWHFVSKNAGLRRRFPRAAALTFTGRADLQRDFLLDLTTVDLMGFELADGVDEASLREALEPLAERANGNLSIMTPGAVSESLNVRTAAILWGVSQLPLITLLVTALGVANAVVASVRVRRWEFGVLRATGTTRGALVRLVLAEAALVGAVACLLSLGLGFSASWAGVSLAQTISFFGGLAPPMVVPWDHVLGGVAATLTLCLLAGLWPALSIGRANTLELLQAGRGIR